MGIDIRKCLEGGAIWGQQKPNFTPPRTLKNRKFTRVKLNLRDLVSRIVVTQLILAYMLGAQYVNDRVEAKVCAKIFGI